MADIDGPYTYIHHSGSALREASPSTSLSRSADNVSIPAVVRGSILALYRFSFTFSFLFFFFLVGVAGFMSTWEILELIIQSCVPDFQLDIAHQQSPA